MNFKNIFISFIFGGILMAIIYIAANEYNNGTISALIASLPFSIMCCYIISNKTVLINHSWNLLPVIILTIISILILIGLITYTSLTIYAAISISLISWLIIQYLRIRIYPINI